MPAAARLLGATVRTFARRFEDGYDLDPAAVRAALTPRTRLILISNPHNPSGALARPESLAAVGELAAERSLAVLVDEVYRDAVLDGRPAPAATLSPAFVSTSSLTKAYGLASLRCGWTLASPELTTRIRRVRDLVDNWSPMPSDRLAVVAFRNLDALAARARSIIESNAASVGRWLASRPDLECVTPRATLAFPRLKGVADSSPFAEELFARTGTAVAPGRYFGAPAHFRIAFGGAPDRVRAGLQALSGFLDGRAPA
jgi:hypothetical protein